MLKLFNRYFSIRSFIFLITETVFIFIIIIGVMILYKDESSKYHIHDITLKVLAISIILQLNLYYLGLYDFSYNRKIYNLCIKILQAIGITCLILAIVHITLPNSIINEEIFISGLIVTVIFLTFWRVLFQALCAKKIWNEPVLLVGDGYMAQVILDEISNNFDSGYTVAGIFSSNKESSLAQQNHITHFGDMKKLCDIAQELGIRKVIVALQDRRGQSPVDPLLQCRLLGVEVFEGVRFYELVSGRILATQTLPSWLIFSDGFHRSKGILLLKRMFDIVLSIIGLVLSIPLIIIIIILIKSTSKGPFLLQQIRVGQMNRNFVMYKFRTMYENAEMMSGAVWAQKEDPRVTSVGKVLRRFRLDEIPQFWNVLKGDMSFVGPRPERPMFVNELKKEIPYYGERHSVKPGITGWAQIKYKYGASNEDALRKLEYDLFYIKNMSILFDMYIVSKTIKAIFLGNGVR
jgi:sugar transferase (PEP-CTERM system associated)